MAKKYSEIQTCGHCGNIAPMEMVGSVDATEYTEIEEGGGFYEGDCYDVLKCPACKKPTISTYFWHDFMDDGEEVKSETLYPLPAKYPIGMPPRIYKAYEAADKIKQIDAEIYAIALRKVLELVCVEKNAQGKFLANKLQDLANRSEIPSNLVKVAEGLKDFGNIGAHAGLGNFSSEEIPIAEALCKAILEYVYSAPHLAKIAEDKLNQIKKTGKNL